ncbi:MAG: 3-hydroxyacyl-ACP dehydratase FabZ [Lachnospiraceae bacterium]|nr:3-hydroxyacyl-ACP dehydratase FabZ [Lachnospiraceae bacterium]
MSVLNTQEIMEILPHRSPFLLIDTIEEMVPGEKIVGKKCVTFNEPFFNGHFPGNPVMPGVLIVEALAQTGAVLILSQDEFKGKTAYFAGLDKVRFKRKVVPGDVLMLECSAGTFKGSLGKASCIARVDGEVAVTAEMMFAIG